MMVKNVLTEILHTAKQFQKACFAVLFLLVPIIAYPQEINVIYSAKGGFYEDSFHLSLSCPINGCTIHYTTNGNTPTANDLVYSVPLYLDQNLYSRSDIYTIQDCLDKDWYLPDSIQKCIVIRAAAFDASNHRVGPVYTNSYFIRSIGCDTHNLPVVSLCADSLDLFDYEMGIFVPGATFDPSNPDETGNYYQSGREWERPVNMEFYELDNAGINQTAGLRTHGGNGRGIQQKSMKVYARKEYGKKWFVHRFFETTPIDSIKHLVLKPLTSTWFQAGVNDHICNQIASHLNLETLASRPVSLFLNGEYWGIYYLHEKPDERYLEYHCHADIDEINLIEDWHGTCEAGSNNNFLELYDFIANNDLTDPNAYAYVSKHIDISNFIDYQIFEIFTANLDWPANNMRCWQEGDGPWRWIFFDGDLCLIKKEFDAFANATFNGASAYPASPTSTLFLRKLLENESFKVDFINRFNQLLYSAFSYETTKMLNDKAFKTLKEEIPNQVARFNNPISLENWERHMDGVNVFLAQRRDFVTEQLHNHYLSEAYSFTFDAIYPTPAQNEIYIQTDFDKTAFAVIQIFDLTGRLQYSKNWAFAAGKSKLILPIHLPSGIYILRIGDTNRKFVVFN